jgi:hypothetical protein
MDDAYDRLTYAQQISINKAMFIRAYNIVVQCGDDTQKLDTAILAEEGHLRADLARYCRLVRSVM